MNALRKQTNAKQKQGNAPKVNTGKKDVKWTDIAGIAVNVVLALFTYFLFQEAVRQREASTQAVNIAQQALEDSRENDSIARRREIERDSLDSIVRSRDFIRDTTNTRLNRQALQTQINATKENQNQFLAANEPYLNIYSIEIIQFAVGKPLIISIGIENLGNYACKIIEDKTEFFFKTVPPEFNEIYDSHPAKSDRLNSYLSKEKSMETTFSTSSISANQYMVVAESNFFIFFNAYFKYRNIITGAIKIYKFQARMKPQNARQYEPMRFLINDNYYYK